MHRSPFVIGDLAGYTAQMGRLVSMMTYVRQTTINAVQGLTTEDLDHIADEKANSIGALLMHIAAVESEYQALTFGMPQTIRSEAALDLGQRAREEIHGQPLDHYLKVLDDVRNRTLFELSKRDDHWLMLESDFWGGERANNYFKWFHVFEDELNHRGQIRFLVKRLPSRR